MPRTQTTRVIDRSTDTTPDTVVQQEPTTPQATREQAIHAIMAETSCTRNEAASTVGWIGNFVRDSRLHGYNVQYPTDRQMRTREYQIFDKIMKHGATSAPGSAAAIVESYLLDPTKDEFGIMHDQRDEWPHYCSVRVTVGVVKGLPQS